ncbi:hypothetical protein EHI46_30610 [Rhizobium leguminosarum]|nr:hypothetical protein EHI43_02900 [Rhizobium leguminosarum]RWY65676.1 hypothetical protein EHI46_30610 [Rhizobium leguminosarum]
MVRPSPLPNAIRGLILIPREDTLPTCHSSPMSHNGYNIADYRDIAPEFGSRANLRPPGRRAQERGSWSLYA